MTDTDAHGRGHPAPYLTYRTRLPRELGSAVRSRDWVEQCLDGRVPGQCLADAKVVVSELVVNAVRHGRGTVEIRLAVHDHWLSGDITDEGAGFEPSPAGEISGLVLVGALVDRWGVKADASHAWFEIALPG